MKNSFIKKQTSSQAFKKFENYVEALKNDPSFSSEMKSFRQLYVGFDNKKPIPKNGLPLPKNKQKHIENIENYHYMDKGIKYVDFLSKKAAFQERYGLHIFEHSFDILLMYNSIEPLKDFGSLHFASVIDLNNITKINKGADEDAYKKLSWAFMREVSSVTPIAVCLHQYMSERDIVDFVKKVYKTKIEPLQKEYRNETIKLKDVRKKSETKISRNDFIYKNRKLPIGKLTSLVSEKYGKHHDYTYIQTIIRKETEKRK